ncbi:MAG: hypothetical protein D9V47_08390 [Clostridia bacterium]|nr:MAG: hypothetical protein D9V47_08390 [Clostridia bacterium]
MAALVCVGPQEQLEFLHEDLEKRCRRQKVDLKLLRLPDTNSRYLSLTCESNGRANEQRLKYNLAHAVASLLTEQWEEQLISKIVNDNYYFFQQGEDVDVKQRARQILATAAADRSSKVAGSLLTYLEDNDYLNLDGFLNFRLPDYLGQLEEAVDKAVDEYLVEKEYKEFMRLLRYFVANQEPRVDKVQVFLSSPGVFQVYDNEDSVLTNTGRGGFQVELRRKEVNYEDVLISALITIAPRSILLHVAGSGELETTVSTLKNVFAEKLQICPGCPKCKQRKRRKL